MWARVWVGGSCQRTELKVLSSVMGSGVHEAVHTVEGPLGGCTTVRATDAYFFPQQRKM